MHQQEIVLLNFWNCGVSMGFIEDAERVQHVIFVCNITDKLSHNKYLYLPEVMDLLLIIEVSMIGEGKTTR